METYILISYLNDFIFCPLSIYFHQLYGNLSTRLYHDLPQTQGKVAHESIDTRTYSSKKNVLQGIEVYSDTYKLCGKIDIFDLDTGILTERKKHIIKIYDGYVFQLYGQYYCLSEMGYEVKQLRFYSRDDNKVFPVEMPEEDTAMKEKFEQTISAIAGLDLESYRQTSGEKCAHCIYEPMCDRSVPC